METNVSFYFTRSATATLALESLCFLLRSETISRKGHWARLAGGGHPIGLFLFVGGQAATLVRH